MANEAILGEGPRVGQTSNNFDAEEWAEVYEGASGDLVRFAAFTVGSAAAEDVVSQALLRILGTRPGHVTNIRAYIYRSVANAARNHLRSAQRRQVYEDKVSTGDPTFPVYESSPELRAAFELLTPNERQVVFLIYWVGLSRNETADWLAVAKGTVNNLHRRAAKKLCRHLDHERSLR